MLALTTDREMEAHGAGQHANSFPEDAVRAHGRALGGTLMAGTLSRRAENEAFVGQLHQPVGRRLEVGAG